MGHVRRKGATTLAVVTAALLLLVGCGSSSKTSSSATTAGSSTTSSGTQSSGTTSGSQSCPAGSAGSSITLQGLLAVGVLGTAASSGAKARFDAANASGQIPCGRKINYLGYLDDGSTPETDLAAARQLIDQSHVFGIVPVVTPFLQSAGVYINQQKVPTIGWGVAPGFCPTSDFSADYLFGYTGCAASADPLYVSDNSGQYNSLFQGQGGASGKTVALIANNQATAIAGLTSEARGFVAAGMKVVYSAGPVPPPPAVVTDYSAYVQALMTSNAGKPPSMISVLLNTTTAFPLVKALRQAGYQGVILQGAAYDPALASAAATTVYSNQWATVESSAPAMATIASALTKAGVTDIGETALAGYLSADMFVQILEKVGPDLTPETFRQAASTFTYSIPDVVGPTYYPAGYLVGPSCGEVVSSNGTKWTITVPFSCSGMSLKKEGSNWVPVSYPTGITLPS